MRWMWAMDLVRKQLTESFNLVGVKVADAVQTPGRDNLVASRGRLNATDRASKQLAKAVDRQKVVGGLGGCALHSFPSAEPQS